jgi:hypothetical protein
MKFNQLILAGLFVMSFATARAAESDYSYHAPEGWLNANVDLSENIDPKFLKGMDRTFETVLNPLEAAADKFEMQDLKTPKKLKWGLRGMMFDMAVSFKGTVGLLTTKGIASAFIIILEKDPQLQVNTANIDSDPGTFDLNVDFGDPKKMVEPVVKSLMATGKVKAKNESKLRSSLLTTVTHFQSLASGIEPSPATVWDISRIRLDLSVSGTGVISPLITAGGGLRVRLEWFPKGSAKSGTRKLAAVDERIPAIQKKMNKFFKDTTQQLDTWSVNEKMSHKGLDLKVVKFALGLSTKFDISIVSMSAAGALHVYFNKREGAIYSPMAAMPTSELKGISVMKDVSDEELGARLGSILGMPETETGYSLASTKEKDSLKSLDNVFKLSAEKFQKGIGRAAKIGGFLADRTEGVLSKSKHWRLGEVRTDFEVDMGGALTVVTITGTSLLELIFKPLTGLN